MKDQVIIKQVVTPNEKIKRTNSLQRVKNILALYSEMQTEGGVDKTTFCKRYKISIRTFTRYISIIGIYLEDEGEFMIVINEYGNYEIIESW